MNWSQLQRDIYAATANTSDSLLIEAVAGSGKTTTIVEAINHVPRSQSVCFLAFNKAIAEELRRRVTAPNAKCLTLHAAGWAAWRAHLAQLSMEGRASGRCEVDGGKMYDVIREALSWDERKANPQLGRLVALAKMAGVVPQAGSDYGSDYSSSDYTGLVEDTDDAWEDLIDHYALDPEECNVALARRVLADSIACAGRVVDFEDMLYMPIVAGARFEPFDVVFLDEAQDVSGIQMEMVRRMVGGGAVRCECPSYYGHEDKGQAPLADFCPVHGLEEYRKRAGGRVIAVGDRHQAIYGFRGAHAGSMDCIQKLFGARELPLSVSYRCPRRVVAWAKQWVPQIEWWEGAEEGLADVGHTEECPAKWDAGSCECGHRSMWELTDYAPGDAILCRINRPLVALTFALIRAKVPARMLGRDIGQGLIKLAQKLGKGAEYATDGFRASFARHMGAYRQKEAERLSRRRRDAGLLAAMHDRLDTLQVFVDELAEGDGLGELVASIERLFGDNGQLRGVVTLSTIHKAKGMEWDRVFILGAEKWMPPTWASDGWQMQQELNLCYVAATRAKRELRYIKHDERGQ